jgi:hypothetical protein
MGSAELMLAAAGTSDGIGEILAALFPPLTMALVFVLILRAALRNTDWKKPEDRREGIDRARTNEHPREPDGSA